MMTPVFFRLLVGIGLGSEALAAAAEAQNDVLPAIIGFTALAALVLVCIRRVYDRQ